MSERPQPSEEKVNEIMKRISIVLKDMQPTMEEFAIVGVAILRSMVETGHTRKESYPKSMDMLTCNGYKVEFKVKNMQVDLSKKLPPMMPGLGGPLNG